ncbi:MFS transporter [Kocuria sp.]|uniref:MFS transporter n=1 Tax=Kocuria sp. TaxID=1871328 RepID=UPI0026E021D9|nr:MFS transporter [Kocuria sp.]MDO5618529.1 MFS transporter [Kocuria sp.]
MRDAEAINRLPHGIAPFVSVRFLSFVADQGSTFLIPLSVYALTGSAQLSGLAFMVQWLPRIILSPLFGTIVDRFPSKPQLMLTDLVRAVVLAVLFIVPETWSLIAASAVLTLANGYSSIVTEQVVSTAVDDNDVAQAQSQQQMAFQTALVLGPALGSWALGLLSLRSAILLFAVTFFLCMVLTPMVIHAVGTPERSPEGGAPLQRLKDGAFELFRRRELVLLLAITMLVNLTGGMALATLPVIVVGHLGGGPAMAGTLAGVAAGLSLATAAAVTWVTRKTPIAHVVIAAPILMTTAVFLLCLSHSVFLFGLGYALWSSGMVIFTIWMRTRRLEFIDPARVGRTLGFFVAIILGSTPVAGLLLAVLGDRVDSHQLLLFTAVFSALALVPLLVAWKRTRRATAMSSEV